MLCSCNNLLLWSCFSLSNFVAIWPKKLDLDSSILKFPALYWFPAKIHWKPQWNPRYSTSGLVNQRKVMTYYPWATENKQKTPCYSVCITHAFSCKASWVVRHTQRMNYSWVKGFCWNWVFWVVERRSILCFFCMKEQVLLNNSNILVIIIHFSNENSNTAFFINPL